MDDAVEVKIRVSRNDATAIATALGETDRDLQAFAELAVRNVVDWLTGRRRFFSMAEQNTAWVEAMLEQFFPDEVPSAQRLYATFNLTDSQAQSIARRLNEREQSRFRGIARAELKRVLDDKRDPAQRAVADHATSVPQSITMSSSARLELNRICEAIYASDRAFRWPKNKGSFGDMRQVEIESGALLQVLERLA